MASALHDASIDPAVRSHKNPADPSSADRTSKLKWEKTMPTAIKSHMVLAAFAAAAMTATAASAQTKYDVGATDTEIKKGIIMSYSGPASAYGVVGKTETVYFNKIHHKQSFSGRGSRDLLI